MQTNLHAVSYYFTASWESFQRAMVGKLGNMVVNLFVSVCVCVWVSFPHCHCGYFASLRSRWKMEMEGLELLASVATWCEIYGKKN